MPVAVDDAADGVFTFEKTPHYVRRHLLVVAVDRLEVAETLRKVLRFVGLYRLKNPAALCRCIRDLAAPLRVADA